MDDISFSQPERRSYVAPALVAFAVIAGGIGAVMHMLPREDAQLTVPRLIAVPIHVTYTKQAAGNGGMRVVGQDAGGEDSVYVMATAQIHDELKVPLFLKDFTLVYTDASGAEETVNAVEKTDSETVFQIFPALRAMAAPMLLRESTVDPGKTVSGNLLFPIAINADGWKQRQSAKLKVALYHQPDLTIDLPAGGEVAPTISTGGAK